jgi:hypothetical protein
MRTWFAAVMVAVLFATCAEDEVDLPTQAGIFHSVVGKRVAFTALTINADTYNWDFGDGNTSAEKNPVHEYEAGGYYTVVLTVQGETGIAGDTVPIAVDVTPYILLTGGPTATNGKTWKLSANHGSQDRFANADAALSTVESLPQGAFDLYLSMGEVYDDTYTFHFDGRYEHDVKADGAAFAALVHQLITTGGANIRNLGGQDFGLCTAAYTPEANATFTYTEGTDLVVPSVYGPGGALTFSGVTTLEFSGTEFVAFWDVNRTAIVQDIQDKSMRIVVFVNASPDYYPLATHALVVTLAAV